VAPPSTPTSHPGRYLTALVVLLIVMLASVLGTNIFRPSDWHKSFYVGRGLDLSSGTSITLQAVTQKQPGQTKAPAPSAAAMTRAVQIITDRVEGSGLSNATVVPQGSNEIVVSVPGAGANKVATLVGETALLRVRQVLLTAPNYTTSSSSASKSSSAKPSSSASPSASASPGASATPSTSASPKASSSPAASATPSATPSASTSPSSSGKQVLSTTADGTGDPSGLTRAAAKLFDKVNCDSKQWRSQIYGTNPSNWDNPNVQTVSCFDGTKYAMDKAVVQGKDISNAQSADQSTGWIVTFDVKNPAAGNLGKLTTTMVGQYYDSSTGEATSPLDLLAIVLDGTIQSAPQVSQAISSSVQVYGGSVGFTETQANNLADVLKYGSLPLSFKNLYTSSVSPTLGSDQLSAGLFAALVGLLLVVVYSFIYYRGLGVVSVLSLSIAAAISYMSVVLLSKYAGFTLTLAGIAGLIVAIGITADSFIVYFERLRDEVREGRSLRAAVERGWGRARRTILVSDTVSFLAALLLYILSQGDVRGFAFTLGLTTLVDVAVVFLFTKPMITLLARTKFYGQGHPLSGLDPARLGARAPWRGSRRPPPTAAGGGATPLTTTTSTKEA
jgi:preprotein translocase subunit SecD